MVKTTTKINNNWSEYDKIIAQTHLTNYGIIFLDKIYGLPIDDLFELEELYMAHMNEKGAC